LKDEADSVDKNRFVQDIFGFSPIGIFHINMDGKKIKANPELFLDDRI
jgi:hypothetical protein